MAALERVRATCWPRRFFYDSNAYNDDLPYLVDVDGRDHLVLPYSFDTNDMRFQRGGGFAFGEDFAHYCIDAFERLYAEGADEPRMMTVGLHLRIISASRGGSAGWSASWPTPPRSRVSGSHRVTPSPATG